MPALRHIAIGEPAHDAERQAIRFLVDGLDEDYVVYSNSNASRASAGTICSASASAPRWEIPR